MIASWTLLVLIITGTGTVVQSNIFLSKEECKKTGDLLLSRVKIGNSEVKTLCYQSYRVDVHQ